MGKLVNEQIAVETLPSGVPDRFTWNRRIVEVRSVTERWKQSGRWWQGEEDSTYWIVTGHRDETYELRKTGADKWLLVRVYD